MNPLTRPRSSGTLSPEGARAGISVINPRPLGGEGGERSEPGEGVLDLFTQLCEAQARPGMSYSPNCSGYFPYSRTSLTT